MDFHAVFASFQAFSMHFPLFSRLGTRPRVPFEVWDTMDRYIVAAMEPLGCDVLKRKLEHG